MWVITPSWLSGSLRPFLYHSSVCSYHLFLVFYASVWSRIFLPFIVLILAWNVPMVSLVFLKRPPVFPILLFSSISLLCSLKKAFLSLLAILWNYALRWVYLSFSPFPFVCLLFTAIWKAFSDNHFALLHFLFLQMFLVTSTCAMLQNSVHSSSGTMFTRFIPWIHLSFPLYNCNEFDLDHSWMV